MNFVVALLQEHAEPRMIGRVMSMYSLAFFVAMPLGYAQAGVLTSAFGPQADAARQRCRCRGDRPGESPRTPLGASARVGDGLVGE